MSDSVVNFFGNGREREPCENEALSGRKQSKTFNTEELRKQRN
jgi:hypothetical protein